ncbi:MAG: hypothetical protein A2W23_02785 [Planctomycetes bacterium RBG_16_43_13]|nr:MAG: hypothetical protein A2W23_02785 [Planctomycetes bacterium RBG_16_43_13]
MILGGTSSRSNAKAYIEVADEDGERQHGLMFRKGLSKDDGMLFIYDNPHILSFYMKNTLIPLSIAYIRADKTIISIHDMKPLDETSIESEEPAKYALEVRQGWFKEYDVKPGYIVILPAVMR